MRPREIHQNPPHQLGRDAEKVRAVLPTHILPVNQPDVSLIDQCGCLQSVTGTLAAHVVMGEAVQLVIDKRRPSCQWRLVSLTPRPPKLRGFLWGIFLHADPASGCPRNGYFWLRSRRRAGK